MGLGGIVIASSTLTLLIMAISAASYDMLCNSLGEVPTFDIPRCEGPSSCGKMAYPYGGGYSYYVGKVWDLVNEFRDRYDYISSVCSRLSEEDLKKPVKKTRSIYVIVRKIVEETSRANYMALQEISSIERSLKLAGAEQTTHPSWRTLYSSLVSVNKGEIYNNFKELENMDSSIFRRLDVVSWIAGKILKIPFYVLGLPSDIIEVSNYDPYAIEKFVNRSVGEHSSILSSVRALRERYESLLKETDGEVDSMRKDIEKMYRFVKERMTAVRFENPKEVARFLPSRTVVSSIVADITVYPSVALQRANSVYSNFLTAEERYRNREQFLISLEVMRKSLNEMKDVYSDVKQFLGVVEEASDSCIKYATSHKFRLKSLAFDAYLISSSAKTLPLKLRACKELIKLVETDEQFQNTEKAFEACKESYEKRWEEPLKCSGTPSEKLLCCKRESERMENLFLSSEEFLRYSKLYSALEQAAISVGDEKFLSELYALPRVPKNKEELLKSYSKLLSLYEDAEEIITSKVNVEWEGYLSSDELSEITLTITNPMDISANGYVEVPFKFVGYDVEGDLIVEVRGKKVYYRGKGTSKIVFQSLPVELKENTMSYDNGFVIKTIENTYQLPVRKYMPYTVIFLSPGAYYKDKHLYLMPGAIATVKIPALEMDTEVDGENISVYIRNTSSERYEGIVSIPVSAKKAPSYCIPYEDKTLCKVNLSPGEQTVIRIRGVLLEGEEEAQLSLEKEPVKGRKVDTSIPPPSSPDNSILEKLRKYLSRAKELNALDVLPFDNVFLKRVERLYKKYPEEIGHILTLIDERIKREAEVRTNILKELAERTKDPDLSNMAILAEKSLLTGDYITPLALSKGVTRYLDREGNTFPIHIVVAVLSLMMALYILRAPKKRRIPKY